MANAPESRAVGNLSDRTVPATFEDDRKRLHGVVLAFSGSWWLLSARRWFRGPRPQGSEDDLFHIEAEFDHIEQEIAEVD